MRVTNLDAVHKIMPHLMENRCNAEVYSYETIDVTDLLKYLDKLNKNSEQKITLFHAVVTAIAKTIYNRPLLNRFVAGKRFYDRNYISISFVAKCICIFVGGLNEPPKKPIFSFFMIQIPLLFVLSLQEFLRFLFHNRMHNYKHCHLRYCL